eukprot:gene6205-16492_t
MADEEKSDGKIRKQEEDYTKEVDDALPKAVAQATASDAHSTGRILEAIVQMCYDGKDWDMLGEYLAVQKMVQKACVILESAPDKETTLKLIDTLRTVTAGKKISSSGDLLLSKIKEADGDIAGAADVLHELQVETYGSMDRREKVEFILDQMRLSLAKKDYIRTGILAKKISTRFFDKEEYADLKLKFYRILIAVGIYENKYLDVCKYSHSVFNTATIQADKAEYTKALEQVVVYLVLSPYDNEQADLVARVALEQKLSDCKAHKDLLEGFIEQEIMPWGKVDTEAGPSLKATPDFDQSTEEGKKRYDDLRRRVVEHNIRVMSKYYSCIKMDRLSALLELPQAQVEEFLSELVVNKTVYAKMDRPKGIVSFRQPQNPTTVLQEWSSEATKLMGLVDRATHLIEKEKVNIKA